MPAEEQVSQGHGVVVLAAYRPDPELFAIQLRSIRDQTRRDFRCLIGADGGQEGVRALVADILGDDPRFEVIGWDDNLGFYLNFERLLESVPPDAAWVALSDQDDRWYPDKLERLVPLLDDVSLAVGQARVVAWPVQGVLLERTSRKLVPAKDLLIQNQVTGAMSVLRRELLDVALPFPRLRTVTQLHDHWLAMCAAVTGTYAVLDEAVQDYVQHGANLIGEVGSRGVVWTPRRVTRRWLQLADEYEGGHNLPQVLRVSQTLSFGWRRLVTKTLFDRGFNDEELESLMRMSADTDLRSVGRILLYAITSPRVSPSTAATMVAGTPGEVLRLWQGRQTGARNDQSQRLTARGPGVGVTTEVPRPIVDTHCWLCGTATSADMTFGADGFNRCPACGLVFQPARNSAAVESARYTGDYFAQYAHRDEEKGSYDDVGQRRYEARQRVRFVAKHHERGLSLIEIGSASGYFVDAATRAGYDALGVEPAVETARQAAAAGLPVRAGTLMDVATDGKTYDVVCAWHVLEHLPDPVAAIQMFKRLMRETSHLFLETPNVDSVAARLYGRKWAHLDAANHVAHYSPTTLTKLLTEAGFYIDDLYTVSIREYQAGSLRQSALHVVSDIRTLHTLRRRHPSRHEMLRVVARVNGQ